MKWEWSCKICILHNEESMTGLVGWLIGILQLCQYLHMLYGHRKRSLGSWSPPALLDRSQGIFTPHVPIDSHTRTAPALLTQLGATAGCLVKLANHRPPSWQHWKCARLPTRPLRLSSQGDVIWV